MKYNINNNNISKVRSNIEKELESEFATINELLKIDYQYCKRRINLDDFKKVFFMLKDESVEIKNEQKVLIRYNGDPFVTLNLCILAIITKTIMVLDFDGYMIGINTFITEIVNNVLKDFQTEQLIFVQDTQKEQIEDLDKIICIDDIYKYNSCLREKNTKARFYSLYYMDFYRDENEFEDIKDLIYKYAEENQIPVESYSDLEAEEAAQMMANGLGTSAIVLTNNKETKEIFKNSINNKKLYINENPFKKELKIIKKEIFDI